MKPCSIVIPTRDRPANLLRAVRSALSALPKNGEVIVVDDASKVPAAETLLQLSDPRVKVLRNDKPLAGGGSPSRNKGAAAAEGQILFFLDDDDELISHYCCDVLRKRAELGAEFGFSARKFCSVSETGTPVETVEARKLADGIISTKTRFAHRTFPFSAGFWITREAYHKAGPFAETLSTNSDTEYCLRIYERNLTGFYSASPGVTIHEHQASSGTELGNVTTRSKSSDRANAFKAMAQEHAQYLAKNPDAAKFVYVRWAKHALRAKDTVSVTAALSQAPNVVLKLKLKSMKLGFSLT